MNRLRVILALASLILAVSPATAAPRVALVRVKDIYAAQPEIAAAQQAAQKDREALLADPRAVDLRAAIDALRALQEKLADKATPANDAEGRRLAQEFETKRLEVQSLQEEFEKFRAERENAINRTMVGEMRKMLGKIAETASRISKERGYDLVLDSSGSTNTGVPFVLYSKSGKDLTEDVMAALKDAQQPKNPEPTPPPASASESTSIPAPTEGAPPAQP